MYNYPKSIPLKLLRWIANDEYYYKIRYFIKFKRFWNHKCPVTFNEKINYLKLYDRKNDYSKYVDKYEVRSYVEEKIGKQYLIECLGIFENTDQKQFDALPNSFILKATHGSSWVIVCKDKENFDWKTAKASMNKWLNSNFYDLWGEWAYKNIKPRIICEKYLTSKNESALLDYKIYCFNGKPQFVHVDIDRFTHHTRNFYDRNWKRLPFGVLYPQSEREIARPSRLDEMLFLAEKLAEDFTLVRVDMYQVDERVYFGELTFYPGNGLERFTPRYYDSFVGSMLHLW